LFAVSLQWWLDSCYVASGALWGLMCLIKPQYGLMIVWFALRRKFSALAASAFALAAGICLTGFVFGWHEQFQYLNVLRFISAHGESYWRNESINGLLNHLFFNGANLNWEPNSFAPYRSLIYALTVITSLAIIGLAWFWPFSIEERSGPIDFAAMAISATVASPVVWEHHYGILFPIFAVLAGRTSRARNVKLLVLAYVLVANGWGPLNILAGVPVLNALQSIRLFGVMLLLGLLYTWNVKSPGSTIQADAVPHPGTLTERRRAAAAGG
jgi:alpha-1,2-mannosyltransferase